MSTSGPSLRGFAYGEHFDALARRSLGYRLLAPSHPEAWCAEVESLARRLQTAPYPDHWPPTDLFCSVLLASGERLVAVARYGLADHTSSQRRGGLELIGVIAPADLDLATCLTLYRWLRDRRKGTEDLHSLGGSVSLSDIPRDILSDTPPTDPVPILPIRLWQEGALLFAATAPSDPDHRLNLLEQGAGKNWQWLPLVGADFPLPNYAQRGPLIAWTPHLAGVALKVDRKSSDTATPSRKSRRLETAATAVGLMVLCLLVATNLWATLTLSRRSAQPPIQPGTDTMQTPPVRHIEEGKAPVPPTDNDQARAALANAIYTFLAERGGQTEWESLRESLLIRYERAARENKDLRLPDKDVKGRQAIGAVMLLSERSSRRIEETIKKALASRGYDPELIQVACQRIREQLIEEARKVPE